MPGACKTLYIRGLYGILFFNEVNYGTLALFSIKLAHKLMSCVYFARSRFFSFFLSLSVSVMIYNDDDDDSGPLITRFSISVDVNSTHSMRFVS